MKRVGLWAMKIGLMICVGISAIELGPRAQAGDDAINAEMSRIQRGFEIAPFPLNLKDKDRELVGLGGRHPPISDGSSEGRDARI
jgi:hypothetical protein